MAEIDSAKGSLTSQHLLYEFISTESVLNSLMPSFKVSKVNVATARHVEVHRFVYTLVILEDVYFEGRRLPAMPGFREIAIEAIKPGRQIVSVPNGGVAIQHVYSGRKDIMQAAVLQQRVKSVPLPYVDVLGRDPAPQRKLHGVVPFSATGDDRPMAAAYYNSASKRFEPIQNPDRRTLLENFRRRFGRQAALAS